MISRGLYSGMGETSQQIASQVGTGGGIAASTLVATGAIGGPVGLMIGAGIAGAELLFSALFKPDVKKIQSSNDANAVEAQMKQNLANWYAVPANQRTATLQAQALSVYDQLWQKLIQLCSDKSLGSAGRNCISDRDVSNPSVKFPWATWYRDPIANDTNVQMNEAASNPGVNAVSQLNDLVTGGAGFAGEFGLVIGLVALAIGAFA